MIVTDQQGQSGRYLESPNGTGIPFSKRSEGGNGEVLAQHGHRSRASDDFLSQFRFPIVFIDSNICCAVRTIEVSELVPDCAWRG